MEDECISFYMSASTTESMEGSQFTAKESAQFAFDRKNPGKENMKCQEHKKRPGQCECYFEMLPMQKRDFKSFWGGGGMTCLFVLSKFYPR